MPRLPTGEGPTVRPAGVSGLLGSQIDPGAPGRAALAGGVPAGDARSFDQLGSTIATAGARILYRQEQEQHQQDVIASTREYAEAQALWLPKLEEGLRNEEPGAAGFHDRTMVELDDYLRQARERLSTPGAQAHFDLHAPTLRANLSMAAARGEAESKRLKVESDFDDTLTGFANGLRSNPGLWDDTAARVREAIDALPLPEARRDQLKRKSWATLGGMRLEGLREQNPYAAKTELDSGMWDAILPPAAKDQQLDRATGAIAHKEREAEAARRAALAEAKAALAEERGDYAVTLQDHIASLQHGGAGAEGFSERNVRRLYGNRAPRIIEQVRLAEATGKVAGRIATSSFAEDEAELATIASRVGTTADKTQLKVDDLAARAIAQKRTALLKDPAGYALAVAPQLGPAMLAEDPKQAERARAAARQVQTELGVPSWRQRVLPDAAAAEEVARFKGLPAEQWADRIEQLAAHYRGDFPAVMADLVRADLPAEAQVLAIMTGRNDAVARQDLARAIQRGRKGLDDALAPSARSEIDEEVFKQLADYRKSLTAGGGGAAAVAAVTNAAELLARLHAIGGDKGTAAARKAVAQIAERYDFVDSGSIGTFRAPKGLGDAMLAAAARERLELQPDELRLPPRGADEPMTMTDAERRAEYAAQARRGRWVTNERNDGLILLYPNGLRVERADGSRVELDFGQNSTLPAAPTPGQLTLGADADKRIDEIMRRLPPAEQTPERRAQIERDMQRKEKR